jgi:hypothetical protein
MIQNQQDIATRNQRLLSMSEGVPKSKAQAADRQVSWALASRLQGELLLRGDEDPSEASSLGASLLLRKGKKKWQPS